MKINCLLFISFALVETSYGQAPPLQWIWSQGGSGDDFVNGMTESSDGNYVFAGTTASTDGDLVTTGNFGGRDGWLYKTDKNNGTILWSTHLGGASGDQVWKVSETSNGDLITVGNTGSGTVPGFHALSESYVVRLNAQGQMLWHKAFGGTGATDGGENICEASNGNLVFVGKTNSNNDGDLAGLTYNGGVSDLWVAEVDKNAPHNIIAGRNKLFGGSAQEDFGAIIRSKDGGYIVSCRTNSSNGSVTGSGYHGAGDTWVLKLDQSLNVQWKKCYGGTGDDIARNIFQDTDGNYVLTGTTNTANDGDLLGKTPYGLGDYWMFKIDSGGTHNIIWQKLMGGTQADFALCGARAIDGGYLVCGRSFSNDNDVDTSQGQGDCWMAKLNATNPAGPLDWVRTIGGSAYDGANYIIQATDSGVVVAAEGNSGDGDILGHNFHPPATTGEESFTFKFKDSTLVTTGALEFHAVQKLVPYPVPANSFFKFEFYAEQAGSAIISLVNSMGETVLSKNVFLKGGRDHLLIETTTLSPGIYGMMLKATGVMGSGKIIVCR